MLDTQKIIWKPKIIYDKIDDKTYIFEVNYLPRWFWHSVWNALRRIILWYNVWWAITALKIKWVTHEYSTIEWVKESIIDIMLNFKKLRFKIDENLDKIQWISQRFKWIWKFSSEDLKLPSWVELLNEWEYLFEISDSVTDLIIDYRLEKGYWYFNIDLLRKREEKEEDKEIWLLLIDNDFKAVDYVKYTVHDVIDDFLWWSKDSLKIEIKSISDKLSPKELITFAWEVLSSYSQLFVFEDAYIDRSVFIEYTEMEDWVAKTTEHMELKTIPIDALPLSERTRNALIKNNILYVEDLEQKRKNELLSMKWVWRKAVDEINQALANIWKALIG